MGKKYDDNIICVITYKEGIEMDDLLVSDRAWERSMYCLILALLRDASEKV